jgi:archaellum component FlaC
MDLIHTRSIDTTETFQKLDRKYKLKKSSQYPLFRRLQEWKKFLNEQENEINDMKYKCELLQNHFERTIIEIDAIKQECQSILKENHSLKNRIDDVMKVPAISDYAHIIEQTKVLQHGIHIWTKRVNVAEVNNRKCFRFFCKCFILLDFIITVKTTTETSEYFTTIETNCYRTTSINEFV